MSEEAENNKVDIGRTGVTDTVHAFDVAQIGADGSFKMVKLVVEGADVRGEDPNDPVAGVLLRVMDPGADRNALSGPMFIMPLDKAMVLALAIANRARKEAEQYHDERTPRGDA